MNLKEVLEQKNFAVVGDTLDEDKYAHKIKRKLLKKDYTVFPVGKELKSLNDIEGDIDIIDLCISPLYGLPLLKECTKPYKAVVVEPGAANDELLAYLNENQIEYMESSILVALKQYT